MSAPPPAAGEESQAAEDAAPDAEVSFVTRDLAADPAAREDRRPSVPLDDVIIRACATPSNWNGNGNGDRSASARIRPARRPTCKLAYAAEGQRRPLCRLRDARGAGERDAAGKTNDQATGGNADERARPRRSRRATASRPSCAMLGASPGRDQGDRRASSARAAATAA